MIEPARRTYDAETRERLVELFGAPERWATTTRCLSGTRPTARAGFIGATTFRVAVPCSFDLELASAKYFYALPDGERPLAFNFNGTVHYRGDDGRLQVALVPWSCSAEFRTAGRDLARADRAPLPEWRLGRAARARHARRRSSARRPRRGLPTLDACVADCWRTARVSARSTSSSSRCSTRATRSIPYTPGATKNATPTPFGIVYPPAYARRSPTRPRPPRLQCVVEGDGDGAEAEVRFLSRAVSATWRRRGGSSCAASRAGRGVRASAAARRARALRVRSATTAAGVSRLGPQPHAVRTGSGRAGGAAALADLDPPAAARRTAAASISPLDAPGATA